MQPLNTITQFMVQAEEEIIVIMGIGRSLSLEAAGLFLKKGRLPARGRPSSALSGMSRCSFGYSGPNLSPYARKPCFVPLAKN
jgi:hypothetical protein